MNDFFKSIEKLASLKGIAMLLVLLIVLIVIGRNLDFFSEVTFKLDRNPANTPAPPQATVATPIVSDTSGDRAVFSPEVTHLELSPVAFALPAYFLIGVKNTDLSAGYLDVTLDFGAVTIRSFEARPRSSFTIIAGDTGSSVIKGRFARVDPEEAVYLYALLSQPGLDRVLIGSSGSPVVLTAADANASSALERFISPTMISFFRFVFAATAAALFVTIVVLVMRLPFAMAEARAKKTPADT